MLNSYTFRTECGPREINVEEHRAPTDESVRLLREMEKEAESKLTSVNRIENSLVDAVWYVIEDPICFDIKIKVVFKLNGHQFEKTIVLDKTDFYFKSGAQKVVEAIADQISRMITIELLRNARFTSIILNETTRKSS